MLSIFLLIAVVQLFILGSFSEEFSVFKSYKDAKVKPKNYARKIQRTHPAEEYLDETQMKMLRGRKTKMTSPSDSMTDQWSGFDVYKQLKKKGSSSAATSQAGYDKSSFDRRLDTFVEEMGTSNEQTDGSAWYKSLVQRFSSYIPGGKSSKSSEEIFFSKGVLLTLGLFSFVGLMFISVVASVAVLLFRAKDLEELQQYSSPTQSEYLNSNNILLKDMVESTRTEDSLSSIDKGI